MMDGNMMGGKCKCPHHSATKVMLALLWLSALGFWWATAFKTHLLWMDGDHLFKDAVLLGILMFSSKFCGCCLSGQGGHGMGKNMCSHEDSCKCGDCNMCK